MFQMNLHLQPLALVVCLTLALSYGQDSNQNGGCCDDYCLSLDNSREQLKRFSTKTAYDFVKGQNQNVFYYPNCEPVKFYLVARHGARLPPSKSMSSLKKLVNFRDEIIKNYDMRKSKPDRGPLCDRDLSLLRVWQWNNNITDNYDQFLTQQGWSDSRSLALDYQHSFKQLINNIYAPSDFLFRVTNTQRTQATYKAFVSGLFGDGAFEHVKLADTPEKDYLLRPYDQCPKWNEKIAYDEAKKFEESEIFQKLVKDVSTKLGFKYTLEADQIDDIWDMCRYEQSWKILELSAWCSVFSPAQVEILEFKEDLKYYYKSGYGKALNQKIPCELIKDMLTRINSTENPKVVAYFTHSAMIQTFLTALGGFDDKEPLLADSYWKAKYRKWRVSQFGPFSANVAIVRYNCPNEQVRDRVTFFINQVALDLPWCTDALCDLHKFMEQYKEFLNGDCIDKFCSESNSNLISISVGILIVAQLGIALLRNY